MTDSLLLYYLKAVKAKKTVARMRDRVRDTRLGEIEMTAALADPAPAEDRQQSR